MASSLLALSFSCSGGGATTRRNNAPTVLPTAQADAGAAPVPTPMPVPTVTLKLDTPVPLRGESGISAKLVGYTIEQIAESPEDPEAYPAGSGVVMNVAIGGYTVDLSDLSAGYEGVAEAWTPDHRVALVRHDPSTSSVTLQIEKITNAVDEALHQETRLDRGKSLSLGDSAEAVFTGHNHKMVYEGQRSPLVILMSYRREGQEVESGSYNLYPEEDGTWRWRNYHFTIKNYEYDVFMELDVSQLAMEALTEGAP